MFAKEKMNIQPRLSTIERTRNLIRDHSGEYSTYQIWKNLPKKLMYPSHKAVIEHLIANNEIAKRKDGKLIYIKNDKNKIPAITRDAIICNLSHYGYDLISLSQTKTGIITLDELIIQILIKHPEPRFIEAIPTLIIKN